VRATHHPAQPPAPELEPARSAAPRRAAPGPALQRTSPHRAENRSRPGAVVRATGRAPATRSHPSAGYGRQPAATLAPLTHHAQASPPSAAQARHRSDYSESYMFSVQERTFQIRSGEPLLRPRLREPRQRPSPRSRGGRETCCFHLVFLSLSQKRPHRRESHFLKSRAIYLPPAPPALSPVVTILSNSGGLNAVTLKCSTCSEASSHLPAQEPSVFRRETRRAQSQDKPFRSNFSCWLKAAECRFLQLRIISAARKEIKIVIPSSSAAFLYLQPPRNAAPRCHKQLP